MYLQLKQTNVFQRTVERDSEGYRIICHEGGSRCFDGSQKIITKNGTKKISDIKIGDYVRSGHDKKWERVIHVFKMTNHKPCYEITLKNGQKIKATQDHKVWFEGGWHSLKYVVKYWNERNMEKDT
jgi:hypothetical protein